MRGQARGRARTAPRSAPLPRRRLQRPFYRVLRRRRSQQQPERLLKLLGFQRLFARVGGQDGAQRLQRAQGHPDADRLHQAVRRQRQGDLIHRQPRLDGRLRRGTLVVGQREVRGSCCIRFDGASTGRRGRRVLGDEPPRPQRVEPRDQGGDGEVGGAGVRPRRGHGVYQAAQRVQAVQQGVDDGRGDGQLVVPQVVEDVFHLVRQVADGRESPSPGWSL